MDCHMHIAVGCIMAILVSFPDNVYEFNNYVWFDEQKRPTALMDLDQH